MTETVTVRFVRKMPGGGWRIAVQHEPDHLRDYVWLNTDSTWLASLAQRYLIESGRPIITITYDPDSKELLGFGPHPVDA